MKILKAQINIKLSAVLLKMMPYIKQINSAKQTRSMRETELFNLLIQKIKVRIYVSVVANLTSEETVLSLKLFVILIIL